jgi:peptide/nickel transport system ATP-binding protein
VIAEVADRVLVMYAGKIVESTSIMPLFQHPRHPYTLGLLGSLPRVDTHADTLFSIPGQPPDMAHPPRGCSFAPRCTLSQGRSVCRETEPALRPANGGWSACHFIEEMEAAAREVADETGIALSSGEEGQ